MMTFDTWLFYVINHGLSNFVFDAVMPIVTTTAYWRPVYTIAIVWLIWKGGMRGRICAATLVVAVALLDPASTYLLKEPISRLRPYDVLPDVHLLVSSGAGSFPSNHAINNTAAAVILSPSYPKQRWIWWIIAITVSFSRIYCGVHWPTDVIAGMAIGAIAGFGFVKLAEWLQRRFLLHPQS